MAIVNIVHSKYVEVKMDMRWMNRHFFDFVFSQSSYNVWTRLLQKYQINRNFHTMCLSVNTRTRLDFLIVS